MTLELLKQADYCLSKCGRPVPPDSATSVLFLPRGIPIQIQLGTGLSQTIARKVTGDADFELSAISVSSPVSGQLYFQVEMPDGMDLFSALIDITQFEGYGSNRMVFSEPLICPLEARWIMTFNTAVPVANTTQPVMVLFEGADRYVLTGGRPVRAPLAFAGAWPRVGGDGNENLLAPSWQQGFTPDPPAGWDFEPYTTVSVPVVGQPGTVLITNSPPFNTISVTGPGTFTAVIQVDQTNDLEVRRFLFEVRADPSVVAGRVLVRISTGSGYTLTEDYIDAELYIGSSPLAMPWTVKAGDQIFFDLQLVVDIGVVQTGNIYFRAFADGVRKIRL
jgi:hypothetical protein